MIAQVQDLVRSTVHAKPAASSRRPTANSEEATNPIGQSSDIDTSGTSTRSMLQLWKVIYDHNAVTYRNIFGRRGKYLAVENRRPSLEALPHISELGSICPRFLLSLKRVITK